MNTRASTFSFVIGIIFLVIGILLYLTWWFFLWGMLAVLFGVLLVLFSGKPWWMKALVAGVPVLFVAWSFSRSFGPSQTFLIPEGFSGRLMVVQGESCGVPDRKEDGRLIVDVPSNGIAILQRPYKGGWVDDEFFFVDAHGHRTPIRHSYSSSNPSTKGPSVVIGGAGAVGGSMPDGDFSTESPEAIHFSDYFVLASDSVEWFYDEAFEDRMVLEVKECRSSL
ncbi:MAG: hypothetical protein IPP26_06400 [Flavobacteriales bacterium]|nr:hypothetical protein [Flavobacteriales bacterium]